MQTIPGRTAGAAAMCLLTAGLAAAQTPVITDVNPNQSTLQPKDPDGASGGRVNGLSAGPSEGGFVFFAASEWGGIFRSQDGGLSWSHLDRHVPTATWQVKVDPANPQRIYATSFYDGRVNSQAGINVSLDGGATWNHPATAHPPANFCADPAAQAELAAHGIGIDPATPANVFVGTNCGVAISNDSGGTWKYVNPNPGAGLAAAVWGVVVHDGGIIDACGLDGHIRSTNGGTTWQVHATLASAVGCSIAASPTEPYVLFAVTGTMPFESDDAGGTWNAIPDPEPKPQGRIPFVATNRRTGNTFDLWFGDIGLFRTSCKTAAPPTMGGAARCPAANWAGPFTRKNGGHDDVGAILFDPRAAADACPLLFASDGGVYNNTRTASPSCQTPQWQQPRVTPHALWMFGMAEAPAGGAADEVYLGNQDNGSFAAANTGAAPPKWTNVDCCDVFGDAADAAHELDIQCCFSPPGPASLLMLYGPGLTGETPVNPQPTGNLLEFTDIPTIGQFGPLSYAVVTDQGVFITTNVTATPVVWTQLGTPTSPANACGIKVSTTPGAPPSFFVTTGDCSGFFPKDARGLFRFDGVNPAGAWRQIAGPAGSFGFGVFDVDPGNPNRIIAEANFGPADPQMVLSQNGGGAWARLPALDALMTGNGAFRYRNESGATDFLTFNGYAQPTLAAFDPGDPNHVVAAGTDSGVFVSNNGGTAWRLVTDPIHGTPHIPRPRFARFVHRGGATITYIGSQGRGAWSLLDPPPPPPPGTIIPGAPLTTVFACDQICTDLRKCYGLGVITTHKEFCAGKTATPTQLIIAPQTPVPNPGSTPVFRCDETCGSLRKCYGVGVLTLDRQFCANGVATDTGLRSAPGAPAASQIGGTPVYQCTQFCTDLRKCYGLGVFTTHPEFCPNGAAADTFLRVQ